MQTPQRRPVITLLAANLVLFFEGCNSDVDELCAHFQRCGGDVVGSWEFSHDCLGPSSCGLHEEGCPISACTSTEGPASGSINFDSDGTFSLDVTSTWLWEARARVGKSCSDAESAECIGQDCADPCDCTWTTEHSNVASGTWSVTGKGEITLATNDEVGTAIYCVSDETLIINCSSGKVCGGTRVARRR